LEISHSYFIVVVLAHGVNLTQESIVPMMQQPILNRKEFIGVEPSRSRLSPALLFAIPGSLASLPICILSVGSTLHSEAYESDEDLPLVISSCSDILSDTRIILLQDEVEGLISQAISVLDIEHEVAHGFREGPLGKHISQL
jgi:hypothetical protein